jgi:diguanylate cyclase
VRDAALQKTIELSAKASRILSKISAANMQYLILAFSLLLAVLFATTNEGAVERSVQNVRDAVNSKPASGAIHLVEIDAKSLKQLQSWPWPRRYHAQLVNQLTKAGAAQIVFDVDFSSYSTRREDAAFANAIQNSAGKVVLPTFRQAESSGQVDTEVESLPIDILGQHAFLGSVNVRPTANGQVNSYPFGTMTAGIARPSIAALLADSSGPLGTEFKIDQSIEIDTIPRHSFVDIITGKFDGAALEGKKVIVGATAIEIGDRYATSRFGVIPGVLIQTLAAETLVADMVLPDLGPWPALLFAFVVLLASIKKFSGREIAGGLTALAVVVVAGVASLLAERFKLAHLDIFPAVMLVMTYKVTEYIVGMINKLSRARRYDNDTGLPNLVSWQRQMSNAQMNTVVVAEIINFDAILSTLNATGTAKFIRAVADRLEIGTGTARLFRIGREQFCWNSAEIASIEIENQIEAIAHLFNAPLLVKGRQIRVTLCFGIASGETPEIGNLSNKSALAAKKAAENGLRFAWHDDHMAKNTDQSLFILSEFEEALMTGQISVVYQPKYSLRENRVTSAEALVRWSHPDEGTISPSVFVPVLEQENLMQALTLFVLRQVVDELAKWNSFSEPMGCAINVSGSLLTNSAFADRAIDIIKASGVAPNLITIELTETAVLSSPDLAEVTLGRFKKLGTRLSIDDYGTGQSTLSYLRKFDADEIKIDQSFVQMIATDNANRIMVRSTIEMAKALDISVVAEGVEDAETMDILAELGCDIIQGWHIGKPTSNTQFVDKWCYIDNAKKTMAR